METNKKQKARQMYITGFSPAEIKQRFKVDKHTFEKWTKEWIAELQKIKSDEKQMRIDYIKLVEHELFTEINKKKDEKYVNELTYIYKSYLV